MKRRDHSMRSAVRPGAFTLLELLVAAFAGAILMAALLLVMGGAWRLQQRAIDLETAALPREFACQRLRCEFQAAVPPAGLLAGPLTGQTTKAGDWRRDDVQWVSAVGATSPEAKGSDLVTLHYYLAENTQSGVYRLVRTERRSPLATTDDTSEETVILDNLVSFAVTWYDGQTWQDSWDSSAQQPPLPQAVRVRLDFAEANGVRPVPLELIVPFSVRSASTQVTAAASGGGGT